MDGMVIVGHRSSKSTFSANNSISIKPSIVFNIYEYWQIQCPIANIEIEERNLLRSPRLKCLTKTTPHSEDILFILMKPFELLKVQSKMELGRQYECSFEKSRNFKFENFIFQVILQ